MNQERDIKLLLQRWILHQKSKSYTLKYIFLIISIYYFPFLYYIEECSLGFHNISFFLGHKTLWSYSHTSNIWHYCHVGTKTRPKNDVCLNTNKILETWSNNLIDSTCLYKISYWYLRAQHMFILSVKDWFKI